MAPRNIPNFIIAGAPKCGTTALANYLGQSSEVFIPRIKEPHFFCDDFKEFRRVKENLEYLNLYDKASDKQKTGDASVWYLYSQNAAERASKYVPDARVIVMFRDPVEMLPSLHFQLKFSGREDTATVSEAWSLIAERKAGRRLPKRVIEPSHLFYDEVCNYWSQLQRWRAVYPDDQIMVIDFDKFRSDPQAMTRRVFHFLGVEPPNNLNTSPVNEARAHRYPRIAELLRHPPFPLSHLKNVVKQNAWVNANAPLRGVYAKMSRRQKPEPFSEVICQEVVKHYASEMNAMRAFAEREIK